MISRYLVSILYHEAKHRRIPMTKLTDALLVEALRAAPVWHTATNLQISDQAIANTQAPRIAQAA